MRNDPAAYTAARTRRGDTPSARLTREIVCTFHGAQRNARTRIGDTPGNTPASVSVSALSVARTIDPSRGTGSNPAVESQTGLSGGGWWSVPRVTGPGTSTTTGDGGRNEANTRAHTHVTSRAFRNTAS